MSAWSVLVSSANEVSVRSSRSGAPILTEDSPRETLCEWLQWCDPNGSHTDTIATSQGFDPYTIEAAWDAIEQMVIDV